MQSRFFIPAFGKLLCFQYDKLGGKTRQEQGRNISNIFRRLRGNQASAGVDISSDVADGRGERLLGNGDSNKEQFGYE